MSRSNYGGDFEVDGQSVEIDMAEWGWERPSADQIDGHATEQDGEPDTRVRLQKALANAGVASRRACETLIIRGRVTVNGEIEQELGSRIDPELDEVRVDGVVVQLDVSKRYFVLNKPRGVVSTMHDEAGRPDLREFTDRIEDRLYNVGRLDTDTSGLLVLTNDGDLAHKLAHPSFGVQKTYIAKVRGQVAPAVIQRLRDGIELSDGPIHADRAKLLSEGTSHTHSLVELTLHSGRNRIVRRMLAEVGHPVDELVRRQFGPLHLGSLRHGEMRELSAAERGALLTAAEGDGDLASGAAGAGRAASGSRAGGGRAKGGSRGGGPKGNRGQITAGRPGDGKGAKGMRGVAAKGTARGTGGVAGGSGGGISGGSGGNRGSSAPKHRDGAQGGSGGSGAAGRRGHAGGQRNSGGR